jgi:hypothetical protein
MLFYDQADIDEMRRADPHGLRSNTDLERAALILALHRAVANVQDEIVQDIL